MKLFLNRASPYARLALVVIHEKQLADSVELIWTDPWASPPELLAINPAAKVPALVTAAGQPITESTCICTYLDDAGHGARLSPAAAPEGVPALMKYGLGRGLIDSAFGVTIERRYSNPDGAAVLPQRWLAAVERTISVLDKDSASMQASRQPDIGDLAIAVGLGYVEFRLPEVRWRESARALADWFDRISERSSMRLTAPA